MPKKVKSFLTGLSLFALPVVVAAQGESFQDLIDTVQGWIDTLIPLIIGLALLFFLYGLARYMLAGADEEAREEGRSLMIYGVITLFVMVAVWGLVTFLVDTFGLEQDSAPFTPESPS